MANESLRRVNTSGGNRRVWTWAAWLKRSNITPSGNICPFSGANPVFNTSGQQELSLLLGTGDDFSVYFGTSGVSIDGTVTPTQRFRDSGNWFHLIVAFDSTKVTSSDRVKIYLNGNLITDFSASSYPSRNYDTAVNRSGFTINVGGKSASGNEWLGEMFDVFFIDGQALTPDVFGFYKQGKGYISVGSTQATDFRPGQWVPKTPRVIKTEINRRGGFGVNGFYLPMNDSKNFGADFHCDPNSIITLNEKLPQPRVGVATTASVGLGYTDALRADPYAANLVLALPFVSGGLSSGFGDYSAAIKGSGTEKTITNNTSVSIANTHGYYGSSVYIDSVNYLSSSSADFAMGTGDFTVEGWINQTGGDTTYGGMFSTATSDSSGTGIVIARDQCWLGSNAVAVSVSAPGGTFWTLNQWTHIAFVRKTNILTVFVNGVAVGITTNVTSNVGKTDAAIGRRYYNNSSFTPIAYIQDLRVYKGVAKYTGGFDVPRPYTPVGIATWRAVPDTTANNFATTNPLDLKQANGSLTFSDGNLKLVGATANRHTRTTIGVTSTSVISGSQSKWYWEYYCLSSSPNFHHGISAGESIEKLGVDYLGSAVNTWGYWPNTSGSNNAYWRNEGPGPVYGDLPRAGQGDIMMFALDMTSGKIYAGINGTWFKSGNPATGANALSTNVPRDGTSVFPHFMQYDTTGISINFGQNPTFSGNTTAGTFTDSNGKGLFKYQPPSGFLALCEDNLPTPAISNPGEHFKTVLYTGDGNSGRSIVGVGFTPDLVWYKARNSAYGNGLFDSIRGALRLASDGTGAENTDQGVISFNSDGFSLGNHISGNGSGTTYAAWCWRAGAGTTSTNTNGSITSVVSVNQTAGFSIVSYNGNSTSGATVGHGLGKAPSMVIIKARDAARGWNVYHQGLGNTKYIQLSSTAAAVTNSGWWNNTSPNSSTFTLGNDNDVNGSGVGRYIAYCWAEIEGFSKMGSYVGNGNADGPMVWCGFKPAVVMTKRTDTTGSWFILDSSRMSVNSSNTPVLFPNTSGIELGTDVMDFVSNGFKFRSTGTDYNASGGTYIFAAFAESPFQTANSK